MLLFSYAPAVSFKMVVTFSSCIKVQRGLIYFDGMLNKPSTLIQESSLCVSGDAASYYQYYMMLMKELNRTHYSIFHFQTQRPNAFVVVCLAFEVFWILLCSSYMKYPHVSRFLSIFLQQF